MKKILFLMITALITTSAMADDEDYIKYRQQIMKSISANLKATSMLLKGKVNLDGQLHRHAQALEDSGKVLEKLFPEGSDFGETDAKPAVWEDSAGFLKEVNKFKQATAAFNSSPSMKTFGAVGKTCKSCHKAYREK